MHTLFESKPIPPVNIPPTMVPLMGSDMQVEYWFKRTAEREEQLSDANKALLRQRDLYVDLECTYAETSRRAHDAERLTNEVIKMYNRAMIYRRKSFLRKVVDLFLGS